MEMFFFVFQFAFMMLKKIKHLRFPRKDRSVVHTWKINKLMLYVLIYTNIKPCLNVFYRRVNQQNTMKSVVKSNFHGEIFRCQTTFHYLYPHVVDFILFHKFQLFDHSIKGKQKIEAMLIFIYLLTKYRLRSNTLWSTFSKQHTYKVEI